MIEGTVPSYKFHAISGPRGFCAAQGREGDAVGKFRVPRISGEDGARPLILLRHNIGTGGGMRRP